VKSEVIVRKTSDETRRLRGTWRADRMRGRVLPPLIARSPRWLGEHGRWLWRTLGPRLRALGRLTVLDRPAFELLCSAYEIARQAREALVENGVNLADTVHGGTKSNPAARVYLQAVGQVAQLAREFGLTPSSRERLSGIPAEDPEPSLAEILFASIGVDIAGGDLPADEGGQGRQEE
jgi:P27 family predicted phage terminase small subunit